MIGTRKAPARFLSAMLCLVLMLGLMPMTAFAEGTREEVDTIKATAIINVPSYGEPTNYPAFTVTEGSPAYIATMMTHWEKKNTVTGKWDNVSSGNTFTEGTWRLSVQVRIDGEGGKTHKLSEKPRFFVNEVEWQIESKSRFDDYHFVSLAYFHSQEYEVTSSTLPQMYDITVTNGVAKNVSYIDITKAKPGDKVVLLADDRRDEGFAFEKWVVTGATVDAENNMTAKFIMPEGNVTAEATYIPCDISIKAVKLTLGNYAVGKKASDISVKIITPDVVDFSYGDTYRCYDEDGVALGGSYVLCYLEGETVKRLGADELIKEGVEYFLEVHIKSDEGYTFLGLKEENVTLDGTAGVAMFMQPNNAVYSFMLTPLGASHTHKYTANEKKPEALKTAGTCKDKAIYLRSCEVCGKVAPSEAWGTFFGDLDPNNHAGGTTTVNASEPDHKNQVAGYTGDTKCLGCNEIIAYGTTIPAGAHTPSSTWNSNETHHWKECTTMGCGVVIDGSKAEHSSTGANVATCQHKAVCDVCNAEYGALAAHNPASGWTSDASGHWHACQTAGCTEKCDFASHTPDHTGHATEEYAIKCTECGYVIEAQLGHTHVFDKEVATDAYKATDATCTAKATYYKSCACGEKGTATFEYGELADHNWTPATCTAPKTCSVCHATEGDPLGHTEGTEWKSDKDNHWHTCTVAGCGVVIESSKAAHTPDREAATKTDAVKCSVCGYVITPALGHTHDVDTTKYESDETNHWNTCSGCSEKQNVSAHEFEWKIDKDATATEKGSKHEECKVCGYKKAAVEIPATGTPTGPSNPGDSSKPTESNPDTGAPDDPQTGDNSMMGLWIALLFVSGFGVVTTTVYGKKRKSVK